MIDISQDEIFQKNNRLHHCWPKKKKKKEEIFKECKVEQADEKLRWCTSNVTIMNKSMEKLMLNYRPNRRRPLKRLLDEAGTYLSRPDSWWMMMMMMMIRFLWDPFYCPKRPDRLWWTSGLLFNVYRASLTRVERWWREFGQLRALTFDVENGQNCTATPPIFLLTVDRFNHAYAYTFCTCV